MSGSLSGLPCDVATLLSNQCLSCHGNTLAGGATVHLTTWEELTAPSAQDPKVSVAERSAVRLNDTKSPMPPVGARVASSQISALEAWIQDGMPEGTCDALSPANDPFAAAPTCTTARFWTGGDRESPEMHPGHACITCHTRGVGGERGPPFSIAGTLFASGHEPDDCNGVNGRVDAAIVEITDANGKVTRLSVNRAGNFYSEGKSLPTPYTARILYQGRTREMLTPQTTGDCNGCHTQSGADGAPGRIALP